MNLATHQSALRRPHPRRPGDISQIEGAHAAVTAKRIVSNISRSLQRLGLFDDGPATWSRRMRCMPWESASRVDQRTLEPGDTAIVGYLMHVRVSSTRPFAAKSADSRVATSRRGQMQGQDRV